MNKLMFAFLLTAALLLAQDTGGSPGKVAKTEAGKTTKTKTHSRSAAKKGASKVKKGSGGTTTPPPK